MSDISHMAQYLAPAQLQIPRSEDFAVDGNRIGLRTQSMAATLPRVEPAVILSITKTPGYLESPSSPAGHQGR